MRSPQPAYLPRAGGPLAVDRDLYGRLGEDTAGREVVEELVVPIRSGRAWTVPAGHLCRIVVIEGPQVADLNLSPSEGARGRGAAEADFGGRCIA